VRVCHELVTGTCDALASSAKSAAALAAMLLTSIYNGVRTSISR
jgi:hypothetical protein